MDRELYVYTDLAGHAALAGRLWTHDRHGIESATFRYDPAWLSGAEMQRMASAFEHKELELPQRLGRGARA